MTKPRDEKRGCLGGLFGCFAIAVGVVVVLVAAVFVFAGARTRLIRGGIARGMTVEEVIDHTAGWLICNAHAEPRAAQATEFKVWATGFEASGGGTKHDFATRQEMARALGVELGHGKWQMTFGYMTIIPRRMYFDIDFSPDGRVLAVSKTRWGTLD